MIQSVLLQTAKYDIGTQVQLEWEIGSSQINGMTAFVDTNNTEWSLKSNDLDVSKYKGKSVIQGKISDFWIDGNYVIDVTKIFQIIKNDESKLVKKYATIDAGIQIDLSDNADYFIDLDTQNNIIIKSISTFRPVFKITPFLCDWQKDETNCGKIVREWENLPELMENSFISLQSLKFYKTKNGTRFVDDKQGKGYTITVSDDNLMYSVSEYIGLLWKDWINWKIYDRLSSRCVNEEFVMTTSEWIDIKKMNNNRFAIIKWKSDKWASIQCEIFLDDSSKQSVNFEMVNILPL